VSEPEERLALGTGIPLAAPDAALCKRVNSKVYSRDVATAVGLPQPPGHACRTLDELSAALRWARVRVAGGQPVVVKDAYGVSGKGLLVAADERRLDQVWRLVDRSATRAGHDRIGLVVEDWIDRAMDLNYHFTVDRDGTVRLDFVKQALTAGGVHMGHRFPVALPATYEEQIDAAARVLGRRLAADGYFGVVGVDAMVDAAGGLYPVVEINARNNMSTYQAALHGSVIQPDAVGVARHFAVRPPEPVPFSLLRKVLGDTLLRPGGRCGVVVTATATAYAGEEGDGRLYTVLVALSWSELAALEERVAELLRRPELGAPSRVLEAA
jgi:carbamoylphosphate synthase large subunit